MPRWPRSLERLPQPCELAAEASFHPFVLRQNLTSRCEDIRTRWSDLQLIGALRAALSEQTGDIQKIRAALLKPVGSSSLHGHQVSGRLFSEKQPAGSMRIEPAPTGAVEGQQWREPLGSEHRIVLVLGHHFKRERLASAGLEGIKVRLSRVAEPPIDSRRGCHCLGLLDARVRAGLFNLNAVASDLKSETVGEAAPGHNSQRVDAGLSSCPDANFDCGPIGSLRLLPARSNAAVTWGRFIEFLNSQNPALDRARVEPYGPSIVQVTAADLRLNRGASLRRPRKHGHQFGLNLRCRGLGEGCGRQEQESEHKKQRLSSEREVKLARLRRCQESWSRAIHSVHVRHSQ